MTRRGLAPERRDAALKSLQHRGPDGSGSWTSRDGRWTLGHTRLSIIGLNNGEQPMTSPDGAVHLVVNGEFYGYREIRDRLRANGYRFSTESDSEIALHLYDERGMQAASELRGEFAVIIADERQQAMIAIRDRFGIKPLYYSIVNGEVFFASEIKALLAMGVPAAWDLEGATGGAGRSHEKTEFAGISTVPQGCYAIARHGEERRLSVLGLPATLNVGRFDDEQHGAPAPRRSGGAAPGIPAAAICIGSPAACTTRRRA